MIEASGLQRSSMRISAAAFFLFAINCCVSFGLFVRLLNYYFFLFSFFGVFAVKASQSRARNSTKSPDNTQKKHTTTCIWMQLKNCKQLQNITRVTSKYNIITWNRLDRSTTNYRAKKQKKQQQIRLQLHRWLAKSLVTLQYRCCCCFAQNARSRTQNRVSQWFSKQETNKNDAQKSAEEKERQLTRTQLAGPLEWRATAKKGFLKVNSH